MYSSSSCSCRTASARLRPSTSASSILSCSASWARPWAPAGGRAGFSVLGFRTGLWGCLSHRLEPCPLEFVALIIIITHLGYSGSFAVVLISFDLPRFFSVPLLLCVSCRVGRELGKRGCHDTLPAHSLGRLTHSQPTGGVDTLPAHWGGDTLPALQTLTLTPSPAHTQSCTHPHSLPALHTPSPALTQPCTHTHSQPCTLPALHTCVA